MLPSSWPRVLVIAGSDSGGGAGIQADIKTLTALGCYASTAITAITAQNTLGVQDIYSVPPHIVKAQCTAVLNDIGTDAIKIGMLHDTETIYAVADALRPVFDNIPLIIDPVMVSKGGTPLLQEKAIAALTSELLPHAALLTPNLHEAALLLGITEITLDTMEQAATILRKHTRAEAVLLKGGHLHGNQIKDYLTTESGNHTWHSERLDTRHTHGTGCTLASAISAGVAKGMPLPDAIESARRYVLQAIKSAPGLGSGYGPLNHLHTIRQKRA